ncbi:hypothetical protein [Streptomyces sp. NPDC046978]
MWFWAPPLLYAGLTCSVVCFTLLLINRHKRGRTPYDYELEA